MVACFDSVWGCCVVGLLVYYLLECCLDGYDVVFVCCYGFDRMFYLRRVLC